VEIKEESPKKDIPNKIVIQTDSKKNQRTRSQKVKISIFKKKIWVNQAQKRNQNKQKLM